MPWTVDDVDKHNKGLSDHEKKQWVEVANSCLAKGDDDGTAITKANGVIKHNRIIAHTEALLYKKASALVEIVRMQETAALFEGALDNQPEGVLEKHGWKQTKRNGDQKVYTHPDKKGHEIHVQHSSGSWRHYNGDNCVQAGFTGEKMRKHLGESVLNEADPKPRVEKDIGGKPVVPNRQHYLMYFQDMQASHIKDAVHNAHERWQAAEQSASAARQAAVASKSQSAKEHAEMAAANLKALGIEISVGSMVLKQKQNKETQATKKTNKKIKDRGRTIKKVVNTVTKGQSPLLKMIAKGAANALTQKPKEIRKPKNFLATPPKRSTT